MSFLFDIFHVCIYWYGKKVFTVRNDNILTNMARMLEYFKQKQASKREVISLSMGVFQHSFRHCQLKDTFSLVVWTLVNSMKKCTKIDRFPSKIYPNNSSRKLLKFVNYYHDFVNFSSMSISPNCNQFCYTFHCL